MNAFGFALISSIASELRIALNQPTLIVPRQGATFGGSVFSGAFCSAAGRVVSFGGPMRSPLPIFRKTEVPVPGALVRLPIRSAAKQLVVEKDPGPLRGREATD